MLTRTYNTERRAFVPQATQNEMKKEIAPVIVAAFLSVAGWAFLGYVEFLTSTPMIEYDPRFEPDIIPNEDNAHKVTIAVTNLTTTTRIDLLTLIVRPADPKADGINFLEEPAPRIIWKAPASGRDRPPFVGPWEIKFPILDFGPQSQVTLVGYYTGLKTPVIQYDTEQSIYFEMPGLETWILRNLSWLTPVIFVGAILFAVVTVILLLRKEPSRKQRSPDPSPRVSQPSEPSSALSNDAAPDAAESNAAALETAATDQKPSAGVPANESNLATPKKTKDEK